MISSPWDSILASTAGRAVLEAASAVALVGLWPGAPAWPLQAVVVNNTQAHNKALEQAEIFMQPRGGLRPRAQAGEGVWNVPPMRGTARQTASGRSIAVAGRGPTRWFAVYFGFWPWHSTTLAVESAGQSRRALCASRKVRAP